MIIGKGMIAKAFNSYKNNKDILVFASGVSNSKELNKLEFEREKNLLLKSLEEYSEYTFIYFSTCSMYDESMINSYYVKHKLEMEGLISSTHKFFYIFRLPHVVGKATSPTIINYLYQKIKFNESFDLWINSSRNLIDVEDVFTIVKYIINKRIYLNETINIASSNSVKIMELIETLEKLLDKSANFKTLAKGSSYDIDISKIELICEKLGIVFNEEYSKKIISKYYS